ncbi:hypothetical protein NC653_024763 [Populus alba x Populus x berolinensis]|uniref:Uncharacterized protein n=1 Tax=Populus alba x Populus x berolinensis TaxID=444605 RepID=A0AAD6M9M6_9ROSI|nr:hypothetical protein NC653_024763 [Populus alba x Populus x berolinensis]
MSIIFCLLRWAGAGKDLGIEGPKRMWVYIWEGLLDLFLLVVICLQDALLKNKLLEHEKDPAFRRGRSDAAATSESYVKFGWCLHRRFDDKGVLMRKEIAAETLTSRPASCSKKISLAVLLLRADVLLTHDCFSCDVELLVMSKGIPKETNPPLVLKSSKGSPLSSGGGMGDQSLEKENMYQHGYEVWKFDSLVQQSPQHPNKLALPSAWCMMTTRMIAGLLGTVVELILTSSYVVDQLLKTVNITG